MSSIKHVMAVLVLGSMLPFFSNSQQSDFGNWFIYFGDKKVKKDFNWHHEVQWRNYNTIGDLEQLLVRTGVGYNLTENNNNIHQGYGFIRSRNYIPGTDSIIEIDEHRIYQQFISRQKSGRVFFQHRYRFEQRFIGQHFKMRFRYFLSLNIPLNNIEMTDKTVYLSAYNEIFINTAPGYFDRNRLYGGLGYKINDKIRFELGYMNQILPKISRDQLNIISFINF